LKYSEFYGSEEDDDDSDEEDEERLTDENTVEDVS